MADGKVRLVRCPKCANVLPELADYSVYQCGGCGAVLKAEFKYSMLDSLSDKSDGGDKLVHNKFPEEQIFHRSAVSQASFDSNKSISNCENSLCSEKCGILSNYTANECPVGDDLELSMNRTEKITTKLVEFNSDIGNTRTLGAINDGQIEDKVLRTDLNGMRFSKHCCHEGSSLTHYATEAECLKQDRAKLLHKLDTLKDQLSESCNVIEKPRQMHRIYSSMNSSTCIHAFGDHPQLPERTMPLIPCHYLQHPSQTYFPGQMNTDLGPYHVPYPQSSCLDSRFCNPRSVNHPLNPYLNENSALSRCYSIAGGAPFIACCHCFELLQLPRKVFLIEKCKVRCGACSRIIVLAIVNRKLVISQKALSSIHNDGFDEVLKVSHLHDHFGIIDMKNMYSSAVCSSGDENHSNRLVDSKERTNSTMSSPQFSPSWLQDHAINRCEGKANQSTRSDQGKAKTTWGENSLRNAPLAAGIEISFNEVNRSRINRGSESFITGVIKKSFKDFSRCNPVSGHGKSNVTINGHPLPFSEVKKAEKLAGSILPGHYWYDFRGGFWGAMGGPCLGIIPPFIEEFNYPMTENCSGGSTGVFVNGRELHKNDLALLASRGLSTERDKSYTIDICGTVVDEESGEELQSLGKLAPTVDKLRRGFGMKVPRTAR